MKRTIKDILKSMMRVLFRSSLGRAAIGHLIAAYIRLVLATSRIDRYIAPEAEIFLQGEKAAIITFWHGRMLLMPCFKPRLCKVHAMISIHRDGEWIAGAMARFGIGLVRGSSRRGGHNALREALQVLEGGASVAITPDGPRGPFEVAQQGSAALASLTGVPILPISIASSRQYQIRSWDRFIIAFPFSRLKFVVEAPIFVSSEGGELIIDQACAKLTEALRHAGHTADALATGHPVEHPFLAKA